MAWVHGKLRVDGTENVDSGQVFQVRPSQYGQIRKKGTQGVGEFLPDRCVDHEHNCPTLLFEVSFFDGLAESPQHSVVILHFDLAGRFPLYRVEKSLFVQPARYVVIDDLFSKEKGQFIEIVAGSGQARDLQVLAKAARLREMKSLLEEVSHKFE